MLFALYVVEWGNALEMSGEGVILGSIRVAALFFADDVVLIASSAEGLKNLMRISEEETGKMKILLSESKSMVMSSTHDTWDLHDEAGEVFATLGKVMEYKYLGVDTHGSISKTTTAKQKKMVAAARRYRGACRYLSRQGPDVVDVSTAIWKSVAMPAIIFGTESVLVSQTTLDALDKESSRWAKETLNLPLNTPNIVSQVLMGIPSFKDLVYTNQLKFHHRLMNLPKERYAYQALKENKEGNWKSPYMEYMYKIRTEVGMVSFPPTEDLIEEFVMSAGMRTLNSKIERLSSVPKLGEVGSLSRARSAREGEDWYWINVARMGAWAIKRQLGVNGRDRICSRDGVNNTDVHCVTECSKTAFSRKETGVSNFFTAAKFRGMSLTKSYSLFVHGLGLDGNVIKDADYKERGRCLSLIFQKAEGQSPREGTERRGRSMVGSFLLLNGIYDP